MRGRGRTATLRAVLPALRANPGLGRLLAVRFGAQLSDGVFQAALGGAVLFNPERQSDPLAVAAGLAVLLLPYSLVGPFAGALLDRWDRRRVLLLANVAKAVLVVLVAVALLLSVAGPALFVGALAVAGVSRFVLSGLSASLPHVAEPRQIVAVNAATSTAGAMVAVVGAGIALGLRAVVGAGDVGSGVVVATAAVGALLAAALARGFAVGSLGPVGERESAGTVGAVAGGWVHGARAAARAPGVLGALVAIGAHRTAFGVNTLLILLLVRNTFTGAGLLPGGIAGFSQFVVVSAAGLLAAAGLTPWLVRRVGRRRTTTGALALAVVVELALVTTFRQPPVLLAALVLAVAGQVVKLCADAAMQLEVDDVHLGQVFALQDALFNVAYVAAVSVAAVLAPTDGRSLGLVVAAAVVYAVGLVAHLLLTRGRPARTDAVLPGPAPAAGPAAAR
ncbi:MFS transporter [Rhodococcus aerolatus]